MIKLIKNGIEIQISKINFISKHQFIKKASNGTTRIQRHKRKEVKWVIRDLWLFWSHQSHISEWRRQRARLLCRETRACIPKIQQTLQTSPIKPLQKANGIRITLPFDLTAHRSEPKEKCGFLFGITTNRSSSSIIKEDFITWNTLMKIGVNTESY